MTLSKGITLCWVTTAINPNAGFVGSYHCPSCTAVAPYKAPNEKLKLPYAQPERNGKNSLSCLFVPSRFPTLHKFSSIIHCYMLPFFIDCTSLLIPNCCFHFFRVWMAFQATLPSFLALESQGFGYLMSSSWKSSQFSITFAPSDIFFSHYQSHRFFFIFGKLVLLKH